MRERTVQSPCPSNCKTSHKNTSLSDEEQRTTYRAYAFATSPKTETPHLFECSYHANPSNRPLLGADLSNILQISSISRNLSQSNVQRKSVSSIFANRKLNRTIDHNLVLNTSKMEGVGKSESRLKRKANQEPRVKKLIIGKCNNLALEGKSCSLKKKKLVQGDITPNLIQLEQQMNQKEQQNHRAKEKEVNSLGIMQRTMDLEMIRRQLVENIYKTSAKQNISIIKSSALIQKKNVASLNTSFFSKKVHPNNNHPRSSTVFHIKYDQNNLKNSHNINPLHEITFCQLTTPQLKPKNTKQSSTIPQHKKRGKQKLQRKSIQPDTTVQPCLMIEEIDINRNIANKGEYYTSTKSSFSMEPIDILEHTYNYFRKQSIKIHNNSYINYIRPKSSVQRIK